MQSTSSYPRKVEHEPVFLEAVAPSMDSIGEFGSEDGASALPVSIHDTESAPASGLTTETRQPGRWARWLVPLLAALALAQAPFVVLAALRALGVTGQRDARLDIETSPPGVEVLVDGTSVGRSPLELSVAPGQRSIELRYGGLTRSFPITVSGGEVVRHRFEFSAADSGPLNATVGVLQVSTDPPGIGVSVDGRARGVSPLSVAGLTAGEHAVAVRFQAGLVEQRVQIQAGTTSAVHMLTPASASASAASGWLSFDSPASVQVFEQGRLLGTTDVERLMLPVGEHVLDFGSDELGFRSQQRVRISARTTSTVRLELPPASLSINASPWAEVWVDGERIGETPIGNLSRPSGRHEVVFRHPELGERREQVLLRPNQPTRLSVDFRQQP
jgi:hypothetical protein